MLRERKAQLEEQAGEDGDPGIELQEQLEEKLEQRLEAEQQLIEARRQLAKQLGLVEEHADEARINHTVPYPAAGEGLHTPAGNSSSSHASMAKLHTSDGKLSSSPSSSSSETCSSTMSSSRGRTSSDRSRSAVS